ncbi:MAG: pyruvate dehydrogenase (acetyl-transferring) E1 component subunit alpha [bacterium]
MRTRSPRTTTSADREGSAIPREVIDLEQEITYLSILDEEGGLDEELDPEIPEEDLRKIYRMMLLTRRYDETRLRMQRQGRIGTFAPVKGQEAAQLGSIYALREDDWFVPAFRETAAAMWRGAKIEDDLLYAAGYEEGIDIPEGTRDLPIAIPVGSQPLHAVGLSWASKLSGEDTVAITYFGDGATSEGDLHEAWNWAMVFQTPTIFICQNNHFAISVPRSRQTRAKTIAQKAIAYGMPGIQVDGNDLLAVYAATKEAVDRARGGDGPALIEAVTYRLSVHTTADDPKKYREEGEVRDWEERDPLPRLRDYLISRDHLTEEEDQGWAEEVEEEVREAVKRYEEKKEELDADRPDMFAYALSELPAYTARQREEFLNGVEMTGEGVIRPKGGSHA